VDSELSPELNWKQTGGSPTKSAEGYFSNTSPTKSIDGYFTSSAPASPYTSSPSDSPPSTSPTVITRKNARTSSESIGNKRNSSKKGPKTSTSDMFRSPVEVRSSSPAHSRGRSDSLGAEYTNEELASMFFITRVYLFFLPALLLTEVVVQNLGQPISPFFFSLITTTFSFSFPFPFPPSSSFLF
jgi:hypothetical protein